MNSISNYSNSINNSIFNSNNYTCQNGNNYANKNFGISNQNKYAYNANNASKSTNNTGISSKTGSSIIVSTYTDKDGRVHTTYTGKGTDVVESMNEYHVETNKDTEKVKKRLDYSYQKVSNQVIMAKNSLSASRAVLSARRSLADLKNKLKKSDCSDDEKQAALAHAQSMLRIALKKKKHLELEEMVKHTMEMDERLGKTNGTSGDSDIKFILEDNPENQMDENNEEFDAELFDSNERMADMTSILELNPMMSELSEELSESLLVLNEELSEEMNELFDALEFINPHMDKEQFEKLKTKNRCEEQKEQVKADMEYLKVIIEAGGDSFRINTSGSEMPVYTMDASISRTSLGFTVMA